MDTNSTYQQGGIALKKLGFSRAERAMLLWGTKGLLGAPPSCIPDALKNLIRAFEKEQKEEENSMDSIDKKIHRFQKELLQWVIKKRLEDQIEIYEREKNNVDSSVYNEKNR